MSRSIGFRNEHLGRNRVLIIGRSLFAGLVGLVPVPYLDDYLTAAVKRGTLKRVADARQVDIDPIALHVIAEGHETPPTWRTVATAAPLSRAVRRSWRRALIAYAVARKASEAASIFAAATLFDHYCARLHVGGEIDLPAAKRLRVRIDAAQATMPRGLLPELFRGGLWAAGKALLRAPLTIVRALRRAPIADDSQAHAIADDAIDQVTSRSLVARAVSAIDRELSAAGRGYLDALIDAFEAQE